MSKNIIKVSLLINYLKLLERRFITLPLSVSSLFGNSKDWIRKGKKRRKLTERDKMKKGNKANDDKGKSRKNDQEKKR